MWRWMAMVVMASVVTWPFSFFGTDRRSTGDHRSHHHHRQFIAISPKKMNAE
jgi:hypothetical protein